MLNLSLQYKKRLLELAGIDFKSIITEVVTDAQRIASLAKSHERVPYNRELMKQAIAYGLEVGLSFRSDNDKYTMPMTKMRTIQPVALGISSKGQEIFRGFHKLGQSESEAIATGVRSAEAENEWRLFKAENVKGMWFTGEMFNVAPPGFKKGDRAMTGGIIIEFDAGTASANQRSLGASPTAPVAPTPASPEPSTPESPGTGDETLY